MSQGRPILKSSAIPSLIDSSGNFFSASKFRKRALIGKINRVELRQELTAQYLRFRDIAGEPDYWCVHENAHNSPLLFDFFAKLASVLSICSMRSQVRVAAKSNFNLYLKNLYHSRNMSLARLEGMSMPGGLIQYLCITEDETAIEEITRGISWPRSSLPLELVIHPATQIEPKLFGNLQESRVKEYQYFSRPDVVDRLNMLGCNLVGYDSLPNKLRKWPA